MIYQRRKPPAVDKRTDHAVGLCRLCRSKIRSRPYIFALPGQLSLIPLLDETLPPDATSNLPLFIYPDLSR